MIQRSYSPVLERGSYNAMLVVPMGMHVLAGVTDVIGGVFGLVAKTRKCPVRMAFQSPPYLLQNAFSIPQFLFDLGFPHVRYP
jgi:hypothetical protein